jgi:hypothetical protein
VQVFQPGVKPYILVPNNKRLRAVSEQLKQVASQHAARYDMVRAQIGDERLSIPREAIRDSQSPHSVPGTLIWDEPTGSYKPFAGHIDPKYLCSIVLDAYLASTSITPAEFVQKAKTTLLPDGAIFGDLTSAPPRAFPSHGWGLFNNPYNDVCLIVDGVPFFVDGEEWAMTLLFLIARDWGGAGSAVSSVRSETAAMIAANAVVDASFNRRLSVALTITIVAAVLVLFWMRARTPSTAVGSQAVALPDLSGIDISLRGTCPNCSAELLLSDPECRSCKATFGPGSDWKVLPATAPRTVEASTGRRG